MINSNNPELTLDVLGTDEQITLRGFRGVVAGYTGRNADVVQHHIDELAAIGIAPPPEVPMFYEVSGANFTASAHLSGYSALTSGEIEPVYIRHAGRNYLAVGSDHTDRDEEANSIPDSKEACCKPISSSVVEIASFDDLDLDSAMARCWVDGELYQEGKLDQILTPGTVVGLLHDRLDLQPEDDFICLGGTISLLSGSFTAGTTWRVQLILADGTTVDHTYNLTNPEEGNL